MPFNTRLIDLLRADARFIDDEGELVLAAVQDRAWRIDHDLVKLLLSDEEIKAKFFDEIEGHWVFNTNTFLDYISQRDFLDNSYTRFRNRIGLTVDGKFLRERGEVALTWPYKDCVLEGGQTREEEKRKEVFFNEVLAHDEINRLFDQKVLTNFARYTAEGKEEVAGLKRDENGVIRENLVIRGNNLLALHTLKTQFRGQVKLIYIDPPYNTGNDEFGYNDAFTRAGWLTFMKNRLEVARALLRDDGVIIVQISDKQVGYLHVLMDEVFPDGFINKVAVRTRSPSGFKTVNLGLFECAEYLLIYGRDRKKWKYNPQFVESSYDENYSLRVTNIHEPCAYWRIVSIKEAVATGHGFGNAGQARKELGKDVYLAKLAQYALENAQSVFRLTTINPDASKETLALKEVSLKEPDRVFMLKREDSGTRYILNGQEMTFYAGKVREIDGRSIPTTMLTNIWTDIAWEGIASEGGVKLKRGKKPEGLLRRLIEMCSDGSDDIVVDFYAGSGTTAAVAHKMGRQYIAVEQLEYGENDSIVRLQNVIAGDRSGVSKSVQWHGGGGFVYCELMQYNEAFMDRIQAAQSSEELLRIWEDMAEGSFLNWYVNPSMPEDAVKDFEQLGREGSESERQGIIARLQAFGYDLKEEKSGLAKQKRLLAEMVDKNQLYVNLSEIDDAQFGVSEEDKALNKAFYGEFYSA